MIFHSRKIVVFCLLIVCFLKAYPSDMLPHVHAPRTESVQARRITGVVTSTDGTPVIGVTISVKDKNSITLTDEKGRYEIQAAESDLLRFSSIGYEPLEVKVENRVEVNITLTALPQSLNEVVVVGYGQQRRADVTASVSTVTSAELTQSPVPTVSQALVGKTAGVTSRSPDGRPGASTRIQIRNLGTPLYVIDGVPSGEGQFNNLSAEDIETISVIKDGSAAIYGLQASNGVVLITTKKGAKNRENTFNVNAYHGWQSLFRFPTPASAADFVRANAEADINEKGSTNWTPEIVEKWQQGAPGYEGFDWSTYLKSNVPQSYINVNTTGGSDKTSYYLSLSHFDQDAVFDGYNFNRTNLQTNIETNIGKRFTAGVRINGKIEKRDLLGLPGDDDYFQALLGQFRNLPTETPYANNNPEYPATNNNFATNYATFPYSGYTNNTNRTLQTSFDIAYKFPIEGLTATGMYAFFYNNQYKNIFEKTYNTYQYDEKTGEYLANGGQQNPYRSRNNGYIIDNVYRIQLNYKRTFGKHDVSGMAGMEAKERTDESSFLRSQPATNYIDLMNQFTELRAVDDSRIETARAGFIFRGNYSYANKYLVEAGGRYDGSAHFPKGNRWGFFPFVTLGWRLSEEKFFQNVSNQGFINDLKLRASYGQTADENTGLGNFSFLDGYNWGAGTAFLDGQLVTGIVSRGLPVTSLTWIKSAMTNIGLDFTLLNSKLSGSFEVFRRNLTGIPAPRYDLLLPTEVGFDLPKENLNANRTLGMELALNYTGQSGEVRYNIGANATFARLKNWYTYKPRFGNSWDEYRNSTENRWARINWSYEYIGQFQSMEEIANYPVDIDGRNNTTLQPGDFIYKDQNNDGVIDNLDVRPNAFAEGNLPYLNFGLNTSIAYQGFDLALSFAGAAMQSRGRAAELKTPFQNDANSPDFLFNDRWHHEDIFDPSSPWVPGTYPALKKSDNESNMRASSFWFRNTAYLRLREVQLGYTLPKKWLSAVKISKARIYVNGFNLFSFDNVKDLGIDPETQLNTGLDYPSVRVYNVGVNLTF